MRNVIFIVALSTIIGLCTSCQGNNNTDIIVSVINDNASPHFMPTGIFTGKADSLAQVLGYKEGIPSSMNAILIEVDGKQILFDTGNGVEDSQLIPELEKLGLTPKEIDFVFITHMHGDHIGGLIKEGKMVFTNAKIFVNKAEMDAWMAMPEERNGQVREMVNAYGKQIVTFTETDDLPCGIQAIKAYGHTEGHTTYRIGQLLIVGDIMHGVGLQLENPEICARFDGDQEKAIKSRKAIIELAKKEELKMYGMHFPTPYYIEFK